MSVSVPVNKNGTIELLDLFRTLSVEALEFCKIQFEKKPIFDDVKLNMKLLNSIQEIVNDKKLLMYAEEMKEFKPEFKTMIVGVIENLMKYEKHQ